MSEPLLGIRRRGRGGNGGVQSAARGAQLVCLLIRAPEGARLGEAAAQLGLPPPTAHRLLTTLAAEGLIQRDRARGRGRYRISPQVWLRVAASFPGVGALQSGLRELLRGLARRTGAAATLGTPEPGLRAMSVGMWVIARGLGPPPPVSALLPMQALSAGKCILAALPEPQFEAWLEGPLVASTPATITDPEMLRQEIEAVRRQGYATHREECLVGYGGVGVAVLDNVGGTAGALQLSAPLPVLMQANLQHWVPLLQDAAGRITGMLAEAQG